MESGGKYEKIVSLKLDSMLVKKATSLLLRYIPKKGTSLPDKRLDHIKRISEFNELLIVFYDDIGDNCQEHAYDLPQIEKTIFIRTGDHEKIDLLSHDIIHEFQKAMYTEPIIRGKEKIEILRANYNCEDYEYAEDWREEMANELTPKMNKLLHNHGIKEKDFERDDTSEVIRNWFYEDGHSIDEFLDSRAHNDYLERKSEYDEIEEVVKRKAEIEDENEKINVSPFDEYDEYIRQKEIDEYDEHVKQRQNTYENDYSQFTEEEYQSIRKEYGLHRQREMEKYLDTWD